MRAALAAALLLALVAPARADDTVERRAIVSANPLAWLGGLFGISASYAVSDHVAIRVEADDLAAVIGSDKMLEVDLGAPIYLDRVYHGAFLEPGVVARRIDEWVDDDSIGGTFGGQPPRNAAPHYERTEPWGPELLLGWHWTGDSGVNLAVAAGVNYNATAPASERWLPNGYVRLGYAF